MKQEHQPHPRYEEQQVSAASRHNPPRVPEFHNFDQQEDMFFKWLFNLEPAVLEGIRKYYM